MLDGIPVFGFRKAFEDAETSGDLTEAYLAWRRFITETLRDGHVAFLVDSSQKDGELGLVAQETAMLRLLDGYFGLEIARCDDGSVLVAGTDVLVGSVSHAQNRKTPAGDGGGFLLS